MNLQVFYLHFDFDYKIDVQVNNPIGLIHNLTLNKTTIVGQSATQHKSNNI
jgi:hypothetical protein